MTPKMRENGFAVRLSQFLSIIVALAPLRRPAGIGSVEPRNRTWPESPILALPHLWVRFIIFLPRLSLAKNRKSGPMNLSSYPSKSVRYLLYAEKN